MNPNDDQFRLFRDEYLDYVEGLRASPPSLDGLSPQDRRRAEEWVMFLHAARGVDSHSSRPSVADLLDRVGARQESLSHDEIGGMLETSLRDGVDEHAAVVADAAVAGVPSQLVVRARGVRVRVVLVPPRADLDAVYEEWLAGVAAVFGSYPDTRGVLLSTTDRVPVGVVVDRHDIVTAIETPSGTEQPPRIRRPITDTATACRQFILEAVPVFGPFDHTELAMKGPLIDLVDVDRMAHTAIEHVASAGRRARVEAKRSAWTGLGSVESSLLSELMRESLHGRLTEQELLDRLDRIVDVA